MSFGYFFNMEILSLEIAKSHTQQMTNDNTFDDIFLDEKKLVNNIKNGFIALTQLTTFFESFLNTILKKCLKYDNECLLKCSIEEKIEIIFMYYQKDFSIIKSQNVWYSYKTATKVRNSLIHFKKSELGNGTGVPKFKITNQNVEIFFTRKNLEIVTENVIQLANSIAHELELEISADISIFECDGKGDPVNYIHEKLQRNGDNR